MSKIATVLAFAGLLLTFASCGNKNEKDAEKQIAVDSTLSRLNSPELKAVNAELLNDPDNAALYYKRAQLYMANKDLQAAEGDAKRAIKIDSLKAEYFILLCDAYFMGNQTRLAKETLEHCLKINPASTDANLKLAELFFYVKKYPEAILYANNALKVNENLAKGYYLKGMCYKENGDTNNAISSFQTTVEQDNKYFDAYVELGLLMAAKKNKIAIEYYNNALRLNPKSTDVYYNIGKFFQDIGDTKMAVETYKKLLTIDPKEKNAIYNLGAIEFERNKKPAEAIKYFSDAIVIDPAYAEAYFARGVCYEELKDKKNAIADYQMALQLKPDYTFAIENLNRLEKK